MTDLDPRRIIALFGDWHEDARAIDAIWAVGRKGICQAIHVGDFGIWPGRNDHWLRSIEDACAEHGLHLKVVPGNHEDWGLLSSAWAPSPDRAEHDQMRPLELTAHVSILPRGHRWMVGGRSFVALGGAPSLDFQRRSEQGTWWSEEQITEADVERTVAGGHADVMIAHDAPGPPWCTPSVATILDSNPWGWSDRALRYAAEGRARLEHALLAVCPRLFAHGHHHVSDEVTVRLPGAEHDTAMWSLHRTPNDGSIRLLSLDDLQIFGSRSDRIVEEWLRVGGCRDL